MTYWRNLPILVVLKLLKHFLHDELPVEELFLGPHPLKVSLNVTHSHEYLNRKQLANYLDFFNIYLHSNIDI